MQQNEARFQVNEATLKNLETHVGQIADMLANRGSETLPSNTEKNPKEHVQAISLRSGREIEEPKVQRKEPDVDEIVDEEKDKNEKEEIPAKAPSVAPWKSFLVPCLLFFVYFRPESRP